MAVKWRRVGWVGYVTRMGEMRNTKFLLETLIERTLGRTRRKQDDNIKVALRRQCVRVSLDWIASG